MNIITLKDGQATHINIITYPDGQRNIELDKSYFNSKYKTTINCRIKNIQDLELLVLICNTLEKNEFLVRDINFYYLYGLRSDRSFTELSSNYVKDFLAPIVNNLPGKHCYLEPHTSKYIRIDKDEYPFIYDSGKRLLAADESFKEKHELFISFVKKRDSLGKIQLYLTKDVISLLHREKESILILDDMCDGGATFIEGAKILKEKFPEKRLELQIAHGIFSKGFDELLKYYDKIYTTNSFQDFDKETLPKQIKVTEVI